LPLRAARLAGQPGARACLHEMGDDVGDIGGQSASRSCERLGGTSRRS